MKHVFLIVALSFGVLQTTAVGQKPDAGAIRGGILNGKAWTLPKPDYPAELKEAGIEGVVFVDVEIDESGAVTSAVATTEPRKPIKNADTDPAVSEIEPAHPMLREAAEKAALQATFAPTSLGGKPVKITGTIVYHFVAKAPASLNGGVLNGLARNLPVPTYPPAAMAVQAEGTVVVQVLIDEGGSVIEATAVSGHPLLRAAAVEAAKGATFTPTRLEGKAVRSSGVVTYNFIAPKKDPGN